MSILRSKYVRAVCIFLLFLKSREDSLENYTPPGVYMSLPCRLARGLTQSSFVVFPYGARDVTARSALVSTQPLPWTGSLTPQLKDLELVHKRFQRSGLVVLGVPSNDFGAQEVGAIRRKTEERGRGCSTHDNACHRAQIIVNGVIDH